MAEKEEMFREELRFLHKLLGSAKSADSVLTESARARVRDTVIKTMKAKKNDEEWASIGAALILRYVMKQSNKQIFSKSAKTQTALSSRMNDLLDQVSGAEWRYFQAIIQAAKSNSPVYIPPTHNPGYTLTLRESKNEGVK